jgi:hypothetical protein
MSAKWAAVLAIAGATIALSFPLVGGAFHPGYDHARQFISELGANGAPNARLVNYFGFLPAGLLLTLFPVFAWRALPRAPLTTLGLAGVALFSIGYVAATFFPCDAGCRPTEQSTIQVLHNLIGLAGYLTAPATLMVLAWKARRWPNARSVAFVGVTGGVAASIGLVSLSPEFEFEFAGVSQRFIEGGMLTWILTCGLYLGLARVQRTGRATPPTQSGSHP